MSPKVYEHVLLLGMRGGGRFCEGNGYTRQVTFVDIRKLVFFP
jgi:hypothetical protein